MTRTGRPKKDPATLFEDLHTMVLPGTGARLAALAKARGMSRARFIREVLAGRIQLEPVPDTEDAPG